MFQLKAPNTNGTLQLNDVLIYRRTVNEAHYAIELLATKMTNPWHCTSISVSVVIDSS